MGRRFIDWYLEGLPGWSPCPTKKVSRSRQDIINNTDECGVHRGDIIINSPSFTDFPPEAKIRTVKGRVDLRGCNKLDSLPPMEIEGSLHIGRTRIRNLAGVIVRGGIYGADDLHTRLSDY